MSDKSLLSSGLLYSPVFWLVLALTLGLMPYTPEPHIWEKLKWIISGAEGMRPLDWFDFLLHASPWVFLMASIFRNMLKKK